MLQGQKPHAHQHFELLSRSVRACAKHMHVLVILRLRLLGRGPEMLMPCRCWALSMTVNRTRHCGVHPAVKERAARAHCLGPSAAAPFSDTTPASLHLSWPPWYSACVRTFSPPRSFQLPRRSPKSASSILRASPFPNDQALIGTAQAACGFLGRPAGRSERAPPARPGARPGAAAPPPAPRPRWAAGSRPAPW